MIVHCSKKLAAKLGVVSAAPLTEISPLGSWHAHLVVMDRRQCVFWCHDITRYVLFLPGLVKQNFAEFDSRFRDLYFATLEVFGCTDSQIKKVELALGSIHYDTNTDRSVQGSLRIVQFDLVPRAEAVGNILELDPLAISCKLSDRPATVYGKFLWPQQEMLALVQQL
jgi:hypothetical protein